MGEKKRLRRELERAQIEAARAEQYRQDTVRELGVILDGLANLGFVWVGGERRQTDRLRAARAGVIVLDDVHVVGAPQYTVEREFIPSMFQGDVPGPLHATLSLELTGDPAVLGALGDRLRSNR